MNRLIPFVKGGNPYLPFVVATPMPFRRAYRSRKRRRVARPARRYRRTRRRRTKVSRLRRFKRLQRQNVGNGYGMQSCQSHILDVKSSNVWNVNQMASLTLYGVDCTSIEKMTSSFERTRRFFQQVDFRGVMYDWTFRCRTNVNVIVNVACISFKNKANVTLEDTTYPAEPYQCPTIAADGFFRNYGNSRDENFDNGLSAIRINYNPISTDQYNVHMHKRITLGPDTNASASYNATVLPNARRVKGFCRINRIIRFNDDAGQEAETPIFLVYWCNQFQGNSGGARTLSLVDVQQQHVAYFRQSKFT